MHKPFRRILIGAMFFVITIVVAIAGYIVSGCPFLDSVYMVVITIFGVGYGEICTVDSPSLRVFTIVVIIAGTSSAVYLVGGLLQMITEGELNRALGLTRMSKAIASLDGHVIICGFGRMGQILARELHHSKQAFVILDSNGDRTLEAQELGYLTVVGNATDEEILRMVGIDRARCLASVLPDDAANVFITLTARELNPNLVILARGEFPSTERKLRLAGANHIVLPATIGAMRMVHMINHPAALDLLEQNDGRSTLNELLAQLEVQLEELVIPANSLLAGGPISDVEVRGRGAFIVVALRRADGTTVTSPAHETILAEGDTLIVMGRRGDIPKFAQHLALKRQMRYRGAKL